MKTREKILDEILAKQPINYEIEQSECLEAMHIYAEQVAIEFLKFDHNQKVERLKKQVKNYQSIISPTPEELFELFKTENNIQ